MTAARPQIFQGAEALAAAAGARILESGRAALARGERFTLALSGGRSPLPAFGWLIEHRDALDWARVEIYFADERAVPPDDPASNYHLVRAALCDPLGIEAARIHRMEGEARDLEAAARAYEARLPAPLDCVVLGLGEDGHIASLFPHHAALGEPTRRVLAVLDSPKPPPRRLTLAPRAIAEAREVLVIATGEAKAAAVAAALEQDGPPGEIPARLVRARAWLCDRAAAAALSGSRGRASG